MTLFWFLVGIGACVAFGRYNRDDSLFWKLFGCLVGATCITLAVNNMHKNNSKEQDKVVMIDSVPTQVLESTPCVFTTVTDVALSATEREKSPKPVSKDNIIYQNNNVLSEVHSSARGQPTWQMYFDDG